MQITYFLMASNNMSEPRVSCDHVQVIFLFVHVIVTYKLFLSNEAISPSDFFTFFIILVVKLVRSITSIITETICQMYN